MKMVCPGCGLTGTADAGLFDRKVRCPGCRHVFRITEAVIVDFPGEGYTVIEQTIDGVARNDGQKQGAAACQGDEDRARHHVQQPGQAVCSRCGFTLSRSFIKTIDSLPVCTACAA